MYGATYGNPATGAQPGGMPDNRAHLLGGIPVVQGQPVVQEFDSALEATLIDTSRLVIKQEIEWGEAAVQAAANAINLEALGRFGETANRYDVYTDDGGKKFRVIETSDYFGTCCKPGRVCCRPNHALKLHVYLPEIDTEHGVMPMDRPCKCGQCFACFPICRQEMKVYEGEGTPELFQEDPSKMIGYIQQPVLGGGLSPELHVMDREGNGSQAYAKIKAKGICCIGGMCCDHTFEVTDPTTGQLIGKIVKEKPQNMGQVAQELGTDADNFSIHVPKTGVAPKTKATMLASLLLLDYMFFEDEGDGQIDCLNKRCKFKCCDLYCCGLVTPCKCNCDCGDDRDEHHHHHHGHHHHHKKHHHHHHGCC